MDTVGIYLIAALAASLAASASGFMAVRARAVAGRRQKSAEEDLPTATQILPQHLEASPVPAVAAPAAVEEVIELAPPPPATPPQQPAPPPTVILVTPAPKVSAKIVAIKGIERKEWSVGDGPMVIGRSQEAECFIPSLTVSRKHAIVERKGSQIILTDCGSRNGTYLRGVRIDQPIALRSGDVIEMGEISLEITLG